MSKTENLDIMIQSNSLRGDFMRKIVDRTVDEILTDVGPMFGPWATDAFITKDGQPYYTRDGKEVMESLMFDNELALYVHHILYQAVVNQGAKVGDGSTTLAVLYCNLYKNLRNVLGDHSNEEYLNGSLNDLREEWNVVIDEVKAELKKQSYLLTKESLKSMLYTCTQDAELTHKLYENLADALMAGAYIIPRKSNISTDFNMHVYNRPTYKVTKQFNMFPIGEKIPEATVLYCHGMLDIAHSEVLASMMVAKRSLGPGQPLPPMTIVILCHGMTEATRRTLRELVVVANQNGWDSNGVNNLVIYTMDEYRKFTAEEFEDVTTYLTDQIGLGSTLIQPLTYEAMLYKAFPPEVYLKLEKIENLELLSIDQPSINRLLEMFGQTFEIQIDPIEGIALTKPMGANSLARYNALRKEIDEEKSNIRKVDLNRRLRRCYGMFIDIEVGSKLLKDSQRKFELILDAVLSASEASQDGILYGNSLIHAMRALVTVCNQNRLSKRGDMIDTILSLGFVATLKLMLQNGGLSEGKIDSFMTKVGDSNHYDVADFNVKNINDLWPISEIHQDPEEREKSSLEFVEVKDEDGKIIDVIDPTIVEPLGVINAILESSVLTLELAMAKVFHISGKMGFMGNYID